MSSTVSASCDAMVGVTVGIGPDKQAAELPAALLYVAWSDREWTRYCTPIGMIQHVGGISAGTSAGAYWTDGRFAWPMRCYDPGWVERPYERFYLRKD